MKCIVMCMLVIVAPPIVMGAWSMAFPLGQCVEFLWKCIDGCIVVVLLPGTGSYLVGRVLRCLPTHEPTSSACTCTYTVYTKKYMYSVCLHDVSPATQLELYYQVFLSRF